VLNVDDLPVMRWVGWNFTSSLNCLTFYITW